MRRYLGNMRWLAMVSTYLLLFGAAIYQFLNTGYLLEMLSTAFTLLMVHLILYRSEETFDVDTGLYNRLAFEKQLTCLMLSKRAASILLINFANVHETRNNFGDEKFFTFIKNTEKKIERIIGILNGYKLYYHSSGNMQIIFNQEGVDIERDFPKLIDMWTNFREDSYISILDPKICIVDFPKDFSDAKKMVKFSLFFQQYLKQGQNLLKASEIINSDAFKIQENISDIIASGLKQNNFEMYYQPIFELKTKKFVSAEALIRLHDPKYGLLSPGTFIPAAERTGLILPIGNFVLESVFSFVTDKELINAGLHYIELNLSMEQLLQKDLLDKINQLQNKYGTPPERINLEITESMAGMHSKTEFNNVETLIKNNFSFSLDDYGTGYSNIKRAIDLPLSLVKIDKSIVDIVETPTGKTIIRNTISMMHDVGFKIVCEGVETESQYRLLEKMDCDYIQGFYFAKPMNKKDFISFLQERNK
ncbi:MAG: EAL domain-containing protein [Treponema sp.]|nr:EAL domain-containing protein [Treponema sp.]